MSESVGAVLTDAAKDLAIKYMKEVLLPKVIAKAIKKLPLLGMKVINPIFMFIVEKILTLAYDEMELWAMMMATDFQVHHNVQEYKESVDQLKIELKKEVKDEAALKRAQELFEQKLRDLVRLKPTR